MSNESSSNAGLGAALTIDGSISAVGNVQAAALAGELMGTPVAVKLSTYVANSDGLVVATLGQMTSGDVMYAGVLTGRTSQAGQPPRVMQTAVFTSEFTIKDGKKGARTLWIPAINNMTMPVKKGEMWSLQLDAPFPQFDAPMVTAYWVPVGALASTEGAKAAEGDNPAAALLAATNEVLARLREAPASMMASAQQAIDERVNDLTDIFGDATRMSADPEKRAQFVRDLQKIVCSPRLPGQPAADAVDPADIDALIATFASACKRDFSPQQRGLLARGVEALVEINANDANRGDLVLIKQNIDLFIDNVQQVVDIRFGSNDKRLLTRALMRIVGDGRQGPR